MHEDTTAPLAWQYVVTIHKFTGRHKKTVRSEMNPRHTAAEVILSVTTASKTQGETHRNGQ